MRLVAETVLTGLLCLLVSEVLLRVPSLFGAAQGDLRHGAVRAHVGAEVSSERHRVVCLGDSVTFGAGVDEQQSYPGQLALQLERLAPGRFEVLNFGVTELDSATARERLKVLLRRLAPQTVVLQVGANDTAIGIEAGGEGRLEQILIDLARHSRLALLLVSEIQDRRIERTWEFAKGHLAPVGSSRLPQRAEADALRRIEQNLDVMARLSRAAGAELVLMTYPGHTTRLRVANRAMASCAERHGLSLVDAGESIRRLPPAQLRYLWAMHPNAHMHAAIAEDVVRQVFGSATAR